MSKKNKLALLLMILIGVGIFFYSVQGISYHDLVGDIMHLNWWWIAVAVLCMVLSIVCEGFVVKELLKRVSNLFF